MNLRDKCNFAVYCYIFLYNFKPYYAVRHGWSSVSHIWLFQVFGNTACDDKARRTSISRKIANPIKFQRNETMSQSSSNEIQKQS